MRRRAVRPCITDCKHRARCNGMPCCLHSI